MNQDKTIALTGGVATGKSTAGRLLSEEGYVVIDCDAINRSLLLKKSVVQSLSKALSVDIQNPDGALNVSKLRSIVFFDPKQRKKVEDILHPMIGRVCHEWRKQTIGPLIIEIPLIHPQWVQEHQVNQVIWVSAPKSLRIKRMMKRGWSREMALNAIEAQPSSKQYAQCATHCLMNQLTLTAMKAQLNCFMK